MNLTNLAIQKLHGYCVHKAAVKNIPAEIEILEKEAITLCTTSTYDRFTDPAEAIGKNADLLHNIMLRTELERSFHIAKLNVDSVDMALSLLNTSEKMVLYKLEISREKQSVEELCELLEVERTSVYRLRTKALKIFTQALFGCVDTSQLTRKLEKDLSNASVANACLDEAKASTRVEDYDDDDDDDK